MKTKYKLMRKVEGTNWRTCSMKDDNGRPMKGVTTDKQIAIKNRDHMRREFPEETYAILEI